MREVGANPLVMTPRSRLHANGCGTTRFAVPFAAMTALALLVAGCGMGDDIWHDDEWIVSVTSTEEHVLISATIADVHGDFIHMSVRREGHDNGYTVERSPAPKQPNRDWSRVHHWFGEMHPNTYLEGRIDDGSRRGPSAFSTYTFELPRGVKMPRRDFDDIQGSNYVYITKGYPYADGNYQYPPFDAGTYEVEIYAWYTGKATERHSAADGSPEVQYVHYEHPLTSTVFVLE